MLQSRKGQQEEVQVRVGVHPSGDLPVFSHDILQKIANNENMQLSPRWSD